MFTDLALSLKNTPDWECTSMQRFHLVFSYYPETGIGTVFEETWCKTEKEALNRVHVKVPNKGKLIEAWLSEWQNPDAAMELLYGYNVKQPHRELKSMMEKVIAQRTAPVLGKLQKSIRKMLANTLSPPPIKKESRIKRAKKPMEFSTVYWAKSWRDVEKGNA